MAINFSASFAACLAAGLKVPRQFMYCIAQEPSAPYVFYGNKEGSTEMGSWGGGPESGHFLGGGLQQQTGQNGQQNGPQGPQNGQSGSTPSPPQQGGQQGPRTPGQTDIHSPAPSPYDHHSQQNAAVGVDEDGSVDAVALSLQTNTGANNNGPNNSSQNSAQQTQNMQQPNGMPPQNSSGMPPQGQSQNGLQPGQNGSMSQQNGGNMPPNGQNGNQNDSDALQALHNVVTPASTPVPRCFSADNQQQNGSSQPAQYYPRPPHVLSPTSFMSYLKQPTVMITSINPHDPNADLHPGMQELLTGGSLKNNSKSSNSNDLRLFKCHTCGKDFKQKSTLLQHERIHTDSRPYGCTECGKRFRQQSHLTQHLRIHANEKPFACVYCDRTFRQRAILNQHLRIHSDVSPHLLYKNGQLWPQDVPFPGDNPKDPSGNHNGFPSQGSDGQTQDGCFSPDQVTQFPAYFKDSKGITHGVFSAQGKVLPDLIQHGRSAGMPLYVRCPICQKEFKQKSTLLQHGCIHIESRPYPCGECGKRFRQQSHLTQHLRIHTNEKPYTCMYCGRNFRQRTILNQHVRIHTGEKPYKCSQCGKDFRQKAILDQHTRTHQGDRPFCCPMPNCRRRFSTESEVKRHIDNHMNPHASKRALNSTKQSSSRNNETPISLVKPELYFPQCYTPSFNQGYQPLGHPPPPQTLLNTPDFKASSHNLSLPPPQLPQTAVVQP